jgi:hypothetical protein
MATMKEQIKDSALKPEHKLAGLWLEEDEQSGELVMRRRGEAKAIALFTWRSPIADIQMVADKFS